MIHRADCALCSLIESNSSPWQPTVYITPSEIWLQRIFPPVARVRWYFPEITSELSDWFRANLSQNRFISSESGTWGEAHTWSQMKFPSVKLIVFFEDPPRNMSTFPLQKERWCTELRGTFADKLHSETDGMSKINSCLDDASHTGSVINSYPAQECHDSDTLCWN